MTENYLLTQDSQAQEPCLIKVQLFEGPLDLLLHLIKKNEVDIYDIPVAVITEQYIEYIELMKEMNLEIVGEYLVIAAELSLIKSKMLLPKPVIEKDELDPRDELVRRLIEYQVYKDAASDLVTRDILGRDVFKRDVDISDSITEEVEMVPVDLWALIEAFREFYHRRSYVWAEDIVIEAEQISIEDKMEHLMEEIRYKEKVSFHVILSECSSKFDLIITFLSILELARIQSVYIIHDEPTSSILLVHPGEKQVGTL